MLRQGMRPLVAREHLTGQLLGSVICLPSLYEALGSIPINQKLGWGVGLQNKYERYLPNEEDSAGTGRMPGHGESPEEAGHTSWCVELALTGLAMVTSLGSIS